MMYSLSASPDICACIGMNCVAGIAHERDEEQPGVEVAEPVGAVGEVVAAAQDLDAAEVLGGRQPDVGVDVDQRVALVVLDVEVQRASNSSA